VSSVRIDSPSLSLRGVLQGRGGFLVLCFVPAGGMDDGRRGRMAAAGERFMLTCGYRGILAIEFFVKGRPLSEADWI